MYRRTLVLVCHGHRTLALTAAEGSGVRRGYGAYVLGFRYPDRGFFREKDDAQLFGRWAVEFWAEDGGGASPSTIFRDITFSGDHGRGQTLTDEQLGSWMTRIVVAMRRHKGRRQRGAASLLKQHAFYREMVDIMDFAQAHHEVGPRATTALIMSAAMIGSGPGVTAVMKILRDVEQYGPARGFGLDGDMLKEACAAVTQARGLSAETRGAYMQSLSDTMRRHGLRTTVDIIRERHCVVAAEGGLDGVLAAHRQVRRERQVALDARYYAAVGSALGTVEAKQRWVDEMGADGVTLRPETPQYSLYYETVSDPEKLKMLLRARLVSDRSVALAMNAAIRVLGDLGDSTVLDIYRNNRRAVQRGDRLRSTVLRAAERIFDSGTCLCETVLHALCQDCAGNPDLAKAAAALAAKQADRLDPHRKLASRA
eukprot:TRINITY_DN6003_c0_g2_i4.p1 TRINITY_DN6003_c0_g2~~TRINITY_DN6003_c0_g2_i4.p1  ORF type:complete len:426 (+),score=72.26 TRINITY_DN6003_c0_g2_i4:74-1351(+)